MAMTDGERHARWKAKNLERYKERDRESHRRHRADPAVREAERLAAAEWREVNGHRARAADRAEKAVHRAAMNVLKLAAGCAGCGYRADAKNMDFHHIDPKSKSFAIAQGASYSAAAITTELAKCVVLCKPCHRQRHRDLRAAAKAEGVPA